ncbi:MAG: hypothetical protein II180_11515, partial [Proteobacteria bacterium]|nr:hypothetical protein [Pseudomonadota bacterium]
RKAREEAERKAREEAERKAREEFERKAREEAEKREHDAKIVKLLATCRKYIDDGDIQEAYDRIEAARKKEPDNLRLEAFAWNYFR